MVPNVANRILLALNNYNNNYIDLLQYRHAILYIEAFKALTNLNSNLFCYLRLNKLYVYISNTATIPLRQINYFLYIKYSENPDNIFKSLQTLNKISTAKVT